MKNKYIGSNFDEFLQEEGLLAETEAAAIKRRSSLERLLDPENPSVTLLTLESVAFALGKRLKVQLG
jgi:hypothetical protein